ncbi:hypothetical protein [Malikia sp.]|uniref:hypothetical protein n=1 Tax=Malikia sp. TaxID=2070706 RepID=UPI00260C93F8|nr:hypothetical protein [Malikia sp.]MDD2728344.1 hypothetical protein [Malikia sp.]
MGLWNGLKGAAAGAAQARAGRSEARQKTPLWRRWWVLLLLAVVGVNAVSSYQRYTAPPEPVRTPEQQAQWEKYEAAKAQAQAEKAAEQARKDAELRDVLVSAMTVKQNLKNPTSFEIVAATLMENGKLCMVYRGTNSFNAVITEYATAMGPVVSLSSKQWNKYCADQRTKADYTEHIRYALR